MNINDKTKRILFDGGITRLIEWLDKKRWSICFDYCESDAIYPSDRLVTISTRHGIEKQLYSLLHECGHILIQSNEESYTNQYPATARINLYASHKQLERSPKYKVDVISEEIEAWKRGKTLAKRLGIHIDEESYNNFMSKCVYSYIVWANDEAKES
jgi:hypothetical protein